MQNLMMQQEANEINEQATKRQVEALNLMAQRSNLPNR